MSLQTNTTNREPSSSNNSGITNGDKATLFLRLFVATMLFTEAITKSQDYLQLEGEYPAIMGLSQAQVVSLVGMMELGAGVLMAIGLFTRITAAIMAVVMVGAAFLFFPEQSFAQAELHVVYAGIYIYMVIAGAGYYSLDRLFLPRQSF